MRVNFAHGSLVEKERRTMRPPYFPHPLIRISHIFSSILPCTSIPVKPGQLFRTLLDFLFRLHPHVENRTIPTAANDLAMHAPLTSLTLRPQSAKSDFQIAHFVQCLCVKFTYTRSTIVANCASSFEFADKRLLASHTRLGLLGKFHEAAEGRSGNGNGAGMVTCEKGVGFLFAKDGLEDTAEWVGELVFEIVLGIDRDVVLEDVYRVFGSLVIFGTSGSFDDDIGHTVTKSWGGASISLLHALCEFDVCLFGGVVRLGEGFGDHKL